MADVTATYELPLEGLTEVTASFGLAVEALEGIADPTALPLESAWPGPYLVGIGTPAAGTFASATPTLPAGVQQGDVLLILCESWDTAACTSVGYKPVIDGTVGTATAADPFSGTGGSPVSISAQTKFTALWKYAGASESNPVVANAADHVYAVVLAFRNCDQGGNPWNVVSADYSATLSGAGQTATLTGIETTQDMCLVIGALIHGNDTAGATWSGWANADLTNVTEVFDDGTTVGNGGGLGVMTGHKATRGVFGSTTAQNSLTSPRVAGFHMALRGQVEPFDTFDGPTFVAAGAINASQSGFTLSTPAATLIGDLVLCVVETGDQLASVTAGYIAVPGSPKSVASQTRLSVFSRIATGNGASSLNNCTVGDSGDHQIAQLLVFRGASTATIGESTDSGSEVTTNPVLSIAGGTTDVDDTLVVVLVSHGNDISGAQFMGWANDDMQAVQECLGSDTTNAIGNGGGFVAGMGQMPFAGTFEETRVLATLASPHWAAITLLLQPPDPPDNDMFDDRTIIPGVEQTTDSYPGYTADASVETGEPHLVGSSFFIIDRTSWWEYTPPFTHILEIKTDLALPSVMGFLQRGDDVAALTEYGLAADHWGEVEGTGRSGTTAGFESLFTNTAHQLQVSPDVPLVIQVGRGGSASGPPAISDKVYNLILNSIPRQDNDEFETAIDITVGGTVESGTEQWDMAGAIGSSDWNPATLDTYLGGRKNAGQLFYSLYVDEPTTVRFRLNQITGQEADVLTDVRVALISADNLADAVFRTSATSGPATNANVGWTEFDLEELTSYFIVIFTTYQLGSSPVRRDGVLEWEFVTAPSNDNFADRVDLGVAQSGSASPANTIGATLEEGEQGSGAIWYEYTPPDTGWYDFTLTGVADFADSTYLEAWRGTALPDLKLAHMEPFSWGTTPYDGDAARLALRAGETYMLRLGGSSFDYEEINWELFEAVVDTGDDFGAETISGASGTSAIDYTGNTAEEDEPLPWWELYQYSSGFFKTWPHSIWRKWTCPADGVYFFAIDNLDEAMVRSTMSVWTGTAFANLERVVGIYNGGNANSTGNAKVAFDAVSGTDYYIQIEARYASNFIFDLVWGAHTMADGQTFADAIDLGAAHTGDLAFDNFNFDPVPEAGSPDFTEFFTEEDWGPYLFGRMAWAKYTAPYTGYYNFKAYGDSGEGFYQLFEGDSLANLVSIPDRYNDPQHYSADWSFDSAVSGTELEMYLEAGVTYHIAFVMGNYVGGETYDPVWWGWWNEYGGLENTPQGAFTLAWAFQPPSNDDRLDALNNESPGNLQWFDSYVYDGVENGPYETFLTGRCVTTHNIAATAEPGEPAHAGFTATRSVWFYFIPSDSGDDPSDYHIWVEGSGDDPCLDPVLAVYDYGPSGAIGTEYGSDDDSGPGLYPDLVVSLPPYDWQWIVVDARDEGEFTLHVEHVFPDPAPANDDFANAEEITDFDTTINGTTLGATVECGENPIAGFWSGPYGSVWYTFTPETSGAAIIEFTSPGDPPDFSGYLAVDVYHGSTLGTLLNVTDADNYSNVAYDETIALPFYFTAGVPVYIRLQHTEDDQQTFTFQVLVESDIPPDNDDIDDAEVIPPGSGGGSGDTDGSGVEPDEPDGLEGGDANDPDSRIAGTTWHKWTAPASGYIDVWTERAGEPTDAWYSVAVWEGDAKPNLTLVRPPMNKFTDYYSNKQFHYEVREGETYWFQVIREKTQTWGAYDLHVNEYLETVVWEHAVDGFDSTTGGPSITGDVMECSSAAMYGTVDVGATPTKNRQFKIHFDVRNVNGQCLVRHGAAAGGFDPAASDLRLGLFRCRDEDGTAMFWCYLVPDSRGENRLTIQSDTWAILDISLGERANDTLGWVSVEIVMNTDGLHTYDSTAAETWYAIVLVDGRQVGHVSGYRVAFSGKRPRYFDFGYWRYTQNSYSATEAPEAWVTHFRRMNITNVVASEPYTHDYAGDPNKVLMFDGFASGKSWVKGVTPHLREGAFSTNPVAPSPSNESYLDVVEAPWDDEQFAVRSTVGTGKHAPQITYGHQWGARRWYGFKLEIADYPATDKWIAGYNYGTQAAGLAGLMLTSGGELRIAPYKTPDFCVAHLALDSEYWIEVHVNAEYMWDVTAEVFINGVSFGTFSNKAVWADVFSGVATVLSGPDFMFNYWRWYFTLGFGMLASGTPPAHDFFMSDFVSGLGNPEGSVGPLKTVLAGGVGAEGDHDIPTLPSPYADIPGRQNGGAGQVELQAWRVYPETDVTDSTGFDFAAGVTQPTLEAAMGYDETRYFVWVPPPDGGQEGPLGDMDIWICDVSGGGGNFNPANDWNVPGGGDEPGFSDYHPDLTGSLQVMWGANLPWWNSVLGMGAGPRPEWNNQSGTLHVENMRAWKNPLVFPRFMTTDDGGATWTWMLAGETDSSGFIGDDVALETDGSVAVFKDTAAAMIRMQVNKNRIYTGWSSQKCAHPCYQRRFYYVEYEIPNAPSPAVYSDMISVNLWVRFRGEWGPAKPIDAGVGPYSGLLRTAVAFENNYEFDYDNEASGPFEIGELVTFGGGGQDGRLLGLIDAGGTGTMIVRMTFGAQPSDNQSIVGQTSGATANVNGTVAWIPGDTRRVLQFSTNDSGGAKLGSLQDDYGVVDRFTIHRPPGTGKWHGEEFDDLRFRFGFHDVLLTSTDYDLACSSYAEQSDQRFGAAVYAVGWEILVPADAATPPAPCGGVVSANWRYADRHAAGIRRALIGNA